MDVFSYNMIFLVMQYEFFLVFFLPGSHAFILVSRPTHSSVFSPTALHRTALHRDLNEIVQLSRFRITSCAPRGRATGSCTTVATSPSNVNLCLLKPLVFIARMSYVLIHRFFDMGKNLCHLYHCVFQSYDSFFRSCASRASVIRRIRRNGRSCSLLWTTNVPSIPRALSTLILRNVNTFLLHLLLQFRGLAGWVGLLYESVGFFHSISLIRIKL
mmetsp:Transcript_27365/g.41628  ORF Transcript_27365/g.41628 Transcript_27365/m.41628 type:complete len:215 (-) Transcript_27365:1696-2340(-)